VKLLRRYIPACWMLCTLLLPGATHGVEPSPSLLVWSFEQGISNPWGGQYNTFLRQPSWARTYLDPSTARTPSGHSLRVTAHRDAEGFCGVWMDFHPGAQTDRQFLDATGHPFLSFWIKGQKGGEEFDVELTDESTLNNEDARPRRPLRAYLPQGATPQWQEVVIPLADFPGLKPGRLARMTLLITKPGDYRFYLDDVAFKRQAAAAVAAPSPATNNTPGDLRRAMWAWNTKPIVEPGGREEQDRLFAFCSQNYIQKIYLAVEFENGAKGATSQFQIRSPQGYRDFLIRAHEQGLKVEALAGTPEWAVRQNHSAALAAVESILAFNRASPPGARFDGVHFDVEPYVLIGYSDPENRTEILTGFLEMVSLCLARVSAEQGMRFSCDVPAWFYPAGGLDRERLLVNFRGAEKTVGEHLTDLLDTVTIMDYINRADGAGGIIARALPALGYAARQGKRIVVGLETFRESDNTVCFVCGLPPVEFRRRLAASEVRNQLYFEGFRMALFFDEVNYHLGLSAPREMTPARRAAFEAAWFRLHRQFGAAVDPEQNPLGPFWDVARAALANDPEWRSFEPFELIDPETRRPVPGFRSVHLMLPSITFYGLGRQTFEEEFRSAVEWLGPQPGFGGMAVHFYDSYRELLEGK
jgi:hypothetical protein